MPMSIALPLPDSMISPPGLCTRLIALECLCFAAGQRDIYLQQPKRRRGMVLVLPVRVSLYLLILLPSRSYPGIRASEPRTERTLHFAAREWKVFACFFSFHRPTESPPPPPKYYRRLVSRVSDWTFCGAAGDDMTCIFTAPCSRIDGFVHPAFLPSLREGRCLEDEGLHLHGTCCLQEAVKGRCDGYMSELKSTEITCWSSNNVQPFCTRIIYIYSAHGGF